MGAGNEAGPHCFFRRAGSILTRRASPILTILRFAATTTERVVPTFSGHAAFHELATS